MCTDPVTGFLKLLCLEMWMLLRLFHHIILYSASHYEYELSSVENRTERSAVILCESAPLVSREENTISILQPASAGLPSIRLDPQNLLNSRNYLKTFIRIIFLRAYDSRIIICAIKLGFQCNGELIKI